jgi:hypothetical protein
MKTFELQVHVSDSTLEDLRASCDAECSDQEAVASEVTRMTGVVVEGIEEIF